MKLSDLLQSVTQLTTSDDGISWYPLRPSTAENIFITLRVRAAIRVLAGKSDAVEWDFPKKKGTTAPATAPAHTEAEVQELVRLGLSFTRHHAKKKLQWQALNKKTPFDASLEYRHHDHQRSV